MRRPLRNRRVADISSLDSTDGTPEAAQCSGYVVWTGTYPTDTLDVGFGKFGMPEPLPVEYTSVYWVEQGEQIWLRGDGSTTGVAEEWIWPCEKPDDVFARMLAIMLATRMEPPPVDVTVSSLDQLPSDYDRAVDEAPVPIGSPVTATLSAPGAGLRLVNIHAFYSLASEGSVGGEHLCTFSIGGTEHSSWTSTQNNLSGAATVNASLARGPFNAPANTAVTLSAVSLTGTNDGEAGDARVALHADIVAV